MLHIFFFASFIEDLFAWNQFMGRQILNGTDIFQEEKWIDWHFQWFICSSVPVLWALWDFSLKSCVINVRISVTIDSKCISTYMVHIRYYNRKTNTKWTQPLGLRVKIKTPPVMFFCRIYLYTYATHPIRLSVRLIFNKNIYSLIWINCLSLH